MEPLSINKTRYNQPFIATLKMKLAKKGKHEILDKANLLGQSSAHHFMLIESDKKTFETKYPVQVKPQLFIFS